jgi:hypothetical protein
LGGFWGIEFVISTGDCIQDIGGPFGNESIILGDGMDGGIEMLGGKGTHGQPVTGLGFSLGTGVGAQHSIGGSETFVTPLWPR